MELLGVNRRDGYVVQKLTGMSFGEFLRTRLFEPLGMTDSGFWCPPEKVDRFASCYMPSTPRREWRLGSGQASPIRNTLSKSVCDNGAS